jgi:hypothetical protein
VLLRQAGETRERTGPGIHGPLIASTLARALDEPVARLRAEAARIALETAVPAITGSLAADAFN